MLASRFTDITTSLFLDQEYTEPLFYLQRNQEILKRRLAFPFSFYPDKTAPSSTNNDELSAFRVWGVSFYIRDLNRVHGGCLHMEPFQVDGCI